MGWQVPLDLLSVSFCGISQCLTITATQELRANTEFPLKSCRILSAPAWGAHRFASPAWCLTQLSDPVPSRRVRQPCLAKGLGLKSPRSSVGSGLQWLLDCRVTLLADLRSVPCSPGGLVQPPLALPPWRQNTHLLRMRMLLADAFPLPPPLLPSRSRGTR